MHGFHGDGEKGLALSAACLPQFGSQRLCWPPARQRHVHSAVGWAAPPPRLKFCTSVHLRTRWQISDVLQSIEGRVDAFYADVPRCYAACASSLRSLFGVVLWRMGLGLCGCLHFARRLGECRGPADGGLGFRVKGRPPSQSIWWGGEPGTRRADAGPVRAKRRRCVELAAVKQLL